MTSVAVPQHAAATPPIPISLLHAADGTYPAHGPPLELAAVSQACEMGPLFAMSEQFPHSCKRQSTFAFTELPQLPAPFAPSTSATQPPQLKATGEPPVIRTGPNVEALTSVIRHASQAALPDVKGPLADRLLSNADSCALEHAFWCNGLGAAQASGVKGTFA
jgi:hypothetical protein